MHIKQCSIYDSVRPGCPGTRLPGLVQLGRLVHHGRLGTSWVLAGKLTYDRLWLEIKTCQFYFIVIGFRLEKGILGEFAKCFVNINFSLLLNMIVQVRI